MVSKLRMIWKQDYTMRHNSWQLLQRFMDAMKAGESFSFCSAATHDGNPNKDEAGCWLGAAGSTGAFPYHP